MYFARDGTVNFKFTCVKAGEILYFENGVDTCLVPDDGSAKWLDLVEKSRQRPCFLK